MTKLQLAKKFPALYGNGLVFYKHLGYEEAADMFFPPDQVVDWGPDGEIREKIIDVICKGGSVYDVHDAYLRK